MWVQLKNLFYKQKIRLKPHLERARIFELLEKNVRYCKPVKFINKTGTLIVKAENPVSAQEIQYSSERILAKLNREIGEKKIMSIRVIQ